MAILRVQLADVADQSARIVNASDKLQVAVFRVGDKVAAINNRCPHAGGSLGEGIFDGTLAHCPLHRFRVNVWNGIGNAGKRVQTFPAAIEGSEIIITIPG